MCGIHLLISKENPLQEVIEKLELSSYRGPDDSKVVSGELGNYFYALGHNRLQINGDETHAQPIQSDRYDFVINGEIYNSSDLQTRYKLNPLFNDSYVLFELLRLYGLDVLKEVNGMYSFVLVDKEKHKAHLVRDSSGQKPLFFSTHSGVKASSVASSIAEDGLDSDQICNYLKFKYTALGKSIFSGVQEVKPGTILTINRELKISERQILETITTQEYGLRETVLKAVSRHSIDSKKIAVLLSGGLDSSIVLKELVSLGKEVWAYTIDTGAKSNPDLEFAKMLCVKLGVTHRIVTPDPIDFVAFIRTVDFPVGDGSFFFNWLLSREIHKDGFKFALTGNGADELYGGYNRHLAFYSFSKYKTGMLLAKKIYRRLPKFLFSEKNRSKADKFFLNIDKSSKQTFLNFSSLRLLSHKKVSDEKSDFSYYDALEHDRKNYLVKDIFSLSDQAGMSNSVEIRAPFLDATLVSRFKKKEKQSYLDVAKTALKRVYASGDLKEIAEREKVGFGIPFIEFFGADKVEDIVENLGLLESHLSATEIESVRNILDKKSDEYSNEYWALLILTAWMKVNE